MTPVRLRFALTARQAGLVLVASSVAFAALFYLALTRLEWPWFSVWVALLVTLAVWAGGSTSARRWLSRGSGWVAVLIGVLLCNLHLYWIQLHRQRSERFDVTGVFVEARADGMSIGVGEPDLDVRLAGSLLDLERWSMRIVPGNGQFRVVSMRGVDWVAQNRAHVSAARAAMLSRVGVTVHWTPLWGLELGPEQQVAIVRGETGTHTLRLLPDGKRGVLLWDGRPIPLERDHRALDRRLAQRLRGGVPVAELPWPGPVDPAARGVVVSLVNGRGQWPLVALGWPRYRVASRDSGIAVAPSSGTLAPGLPVLTPFDTIRVASGGKVWEFALQMSPAERWRSSNTMQVQFVRRPNDRGWAFPASSDCGPQRACALVSSHRLPPPIVHFDLSGYGLDTARYALLGRLDRDQAEDATFRFVSDTAVDTLDAGIVTPVEARRASDEAPRAGWLLRVYQPEAGDWKGVVWTLVALTLFMLAVAWALRESPHAGRWLRTDSPHARAAWMVANLLVVFMGIRLLLGLRVTYAAPYYPRGAGTAAGLWVTVGILTVLFGWWPHLWWSMRKLFGRWLGGGSGIGSLARAETIPYRVNVRRALLPFVATLLLLGVTVLSVQEVLAAAFVVGFVLLSWMAVAITELATAQEQLGAEPFTLLTAESRADRAPWIPVLVTAALGFAIAITSVAPQLTAPLAVLTALGAAFKLWRERRAGGSGAGSSTVLAVSALVAVLAALELIGKLQGPALLLGVVFMLFLLGVRAGVLCQKRLGDEQYARLTDGSGAAIVGVSKRSLLLALSLPFVALGLAAVFDFGLGLIMFLPIFLTVLLAAGWNRMGRRVLGVAVGVLVAFLAFTVPVLFPSTESLARETRIDRRAELFEELGGPMAWLASGSDRARTAVRRAMIRSLAAREPALLEQLLPAVGPGEARDEIIPSIEQAWGGRAYAAAGWFGAGFAGTSVLGRGIAAATSYAENTFTVYVLSEHGAIGGLMVLALYAALAGVLVWWAGHLSRLKADVPRRAAALAVVVGGGLLIVLPAAYVALSNLGVVPLTGQNMPFLGLNAWSDVVFVAGIGSAMLMALTWLTETEERA